MKIEKHNIHNLLFVILFLMAFLERTVWDLGPNIELITTSMILASFYLGRKEAFWLTFAIISVTDRVIGNSNIFLFTWSGFLIPALLSTKLIKILMFKLRVKIIPLISLGLVSNLFYYLWTNFGVWIMDSWGMYTKDLPGLVMCYINGLPFLKNQLISTLIFIPAGIIAIEAGMIFEKHLEKTSLLTKTNTQHS
ncbi:hypothetical protein A2Z67_05890 [Candidatus Woesebacteria bacterium RBG_13_36_22]|uniref:Rod shape-determining protein MreD n=1 Tax=Candidatus Woesebacteria bacterium RBG_13_36_22 TaxID=1802478 RepID=A0A1F7X2B7_9BACT|nr:MAG: hypothetical protein A2Z67_05890 [Candidatus Woesebacteria bacterium RBG_13_36_22]